MIEIITAIGLTYLATGVYIVMVFDSADAQMGLPVPGFGDGVKTVLTWPSFVHFIANMDSYRITKKSVDSFKGERGDHREQQ